MADIRPPALEANDAGSGASRPMKAQGPQRPHLWLPSGHPTPLDQNFASRRSFTPRVDRTDRCPARAHLDHAVAIHEPTTDDRGVSARPLQAHALERAPGDLRLIPARAHRLDPGRIHQRHVAVEAHGEPALALHLVAAGRSFTHPSRHLLEVHRPSAAAFSINGSAVSTPGIPEAPCRSPSPSPRAYWARDWSRCSRWCRRGAPPRDRSLWSLVRSGGFICASVPKRS